MGDSPAPQRPPEASDRAAIPVPPPARVLVTGATGFVGRHVLQELLGRGYRVRCLVRPGSEPKLTPQAAVTPVTGDITEGEGVRRAAAGCQAAIHLVGIIVESGGARYETVHGQGTRNVLAACVAQGVRRLVHLSALGARAATASPYLRSKWEAEEAVRRSSLAYTILRPSLIHGPGGAFTQMLVRLVRAPGLMPVVASGEGVLQPVAVQEIAWLAVQALLLPRTAGHTYDVGGAEICTLEDLLQAVSRVVKGRERRVIRVPVGLVRPVAKVLERLLRRPPFTREQLGLLSETSVCSLAPLWRDFAFRPRGLEESLGVYLRPRH